MLDQSLVSIIIPVYNVELYIERCLESVYKQTYSNIEVILINDCTPDNSMEIVDSVISRFNAFNQTRIISHERNKGLSAARNTGINASLGDYIYFLDSDDDLPANAIETLISLTDGSPDFVIGSVRKIYEEKAMTIYPNVSDLKTNDEIRKTFLQGDWYVMAWNKLINRSFLLDNSLFFEEGIYHEDLLWSFRLALCAREMKVSRKITYKYYINRNTITSSVKNKNIYDYIFILNALDHLAKKNHLLSDSLYINYLIGLKFYIIGLPNKKQLWNETFVKVRLLNKFSFFQILQKPISIVSKIKHALLIAPPKFAYYVFKLKKRTDSFKR